MMTPALSTPLEGAVVHPVRTSSDRSALWQFLQHEPVLAFDTETEGLSFYDDCRLLQLANATEAWVLDPREHRDVVDELTYGGIQLLAHNGAFDAIALARVMAEVNPGTLVGDVESIMGNVTDTQILSMIIDPRDAGTGGIGHGLKPLADHYLGAGAIDAQTELKAEFRSLGLNMASGWRNVPLWNETYIRYAGIDPVLTFRLHKVLDAMVTDLGHQHLSTFDHKVALICAAMTARGIRVAVDHTRATLGHLIGEQTTAEGNAAFYGVDNVNAPQQVAEALLTRGVTLTEKTPTGSWRMDKEVLSQIDDPVARYVQKAKAAGKAAKSWVEPILDHGQRGGRVHARINPNRARTFRMSVTDPGLQQLPTDDWRIRSCLIADEHQLFMSCDYKAIEPRVVAHLSGEGGMIEAFANGVDIYESVAESVYGTGFTPKHRSLAKQLVLAKIYGASAKRLAIQAGVSEVDAKQAMVRLDRSYPRLARWSHRLIEKARFHGGHVTTPSGRHLPVDRGFEFRCVNHITQATAADVFKAGLIAVYDAGYGDRMLLPVHDELLFQGDEAIPDELGLVIADLMGGQLGDVPIVAEFNAAGAGRSWGDAYKPREPISA